MIHVVKFRIKHVVKFRKESTWFDLRNYLHPRSIKCLLRTALKWPLKLPASGGQAEPEISILTF